MDNCNPEKWKDQKWIKSSFTTEGFCNFISLSLARFASCTRIKRPFFVTSWITGLVCFLLVHVGISWCPFLFKCVWRDGSRFWWEVPSVKCCKIFFGYCFQCFDRVGDRKIQFHESMLQLTKIWAYRRVFRWKF